MHINIKFDKNLLYTTLPSIFANTKQRAEVLQRSFKSIGITILD